MARMLEYHFDQSLERQVVNEVYINMYIYMALPSLVVNCRDTT